jgi:hypothetical protein
MYLTELVAAKGAGLATIGCARNWSGAALNFARQCVLQKWYVTLRYVNDPAAWLGSTVIPQTGSLTGSLALPWQQEWPFAC